MTEQEFRAIAGFPGVLGSIDGTHIKICPPANRHNEYLDRTMQHTVTLLAVCDARKKFTWIATGFAGSIHDQRCLSLSSMADKVASLPNQYFPQNSLHIVGDSAFTLQAGLMVPYKDHGNLTQAQVIYNHKHSKTRCVIENTFGFLKNRFRCLAKLEVNLEKAAPIIAACCILHNVALKFPDYLQEASTMDSPNASPSDSVQVDSNVNPNAAAKQRALCSMLS
ncbi:putative nuclease HARBI1 [Eriocheir sinensis]|uniref:putative nuclease HARBI1 n=1 Tax=Eriocheir sinensis TaxID=95602 RepID=UPI0021CA4D4F|nr:putative nuclease HARBI1 [Eriocheir sinensis]